MKKTSKFESIIWVTAIFLMTACSQDLSKERLTFISSIFTGVEQHQNLNRAYKIFPTSKQSELETISFLKAVANLFTSVNGKEGGL